MSGREIARRSVTPGVIAGVVVVYMGAVGMIELFDTERDLISNIVTLGKLMVALPAFLLAYIAVRPRIRGGRRETLALRAAVPVGAGVGLVGGAVVTAAVLLVHVLGDDSVRRIFVSVSPTLLSILQWGQKPAVGAAILMLGGAALGALGAGFRMLPDAYRRPLAAGLFTTFLFALLQLVIPQALLNLNAPVGWLYEPGFLGLTILGAVVIFAGSSILAWGWMRKRAEISERVRSVTSQSVGARVVSILLLLGLAAALPPLLGGQLSNTLGFVAIFVLMGLGLNIVVGFAGLLDLGYVAFFAVGAYLTALYTGALTVTSLGDQVPPKFVLHLNFYEAIPLVVLTAAFVGLLIGAPVLRLRGDYLALVTLGFGEIARVLLESDALRKYTGGAQGMQHVTSASIGNVSFRNPKVFYYLALVFCLIVVYVSRRLSDSRIGRAWSAMREDEQVAEVMGISTVKYKLMAFAMGGAIGSLGGALFAVLVGSLTPESFQIPVSITVLAVVIMGGMGSIWGVVLGAFALVGIPNLLDEFDTYKFLMYGAVLIGIMILRPQGLIPNVRRMRELHEEELEQDVWMKPAGGPSADPGIQVGTGGGT